MALYTQTEAADLLGVTVKTAREWLAGVTPQERKYGKRAKLYTRDRLEAIATARGRTLTDETVPPSVTLESLAARVSILESKLDALSTPRMPREEPKARIIHPAIEPSESASVARLVQMSYQGHDGVMPAGVLSMPRRCASPPSRASARKCHLALGRGCRRGVACSWL